MLITELDLVDFPVIEKGQIRIFGFFDQDKLDELLIHSLNDHRHTVVASGSNGKLDFHMLVLIEFGAEIIVIKSLLIFAFHKIFSHIAFVLGSYFAVKIFQFNYLIIFCLIILAPFHI